MNRIHSCGSGGFPVQPETVSGSKKIDRNRMMSRQQDLEAAFQSSIFESNKKRLNFRQAEKIARFI